MSNPPWYAVYPCGSKLDVGSSKDDLPAALFKWRNQADDFAARWRGISEVHQVPAPAIAAASLGELPGVLAILSKMSSGLKAGAWRLQTLPLPPPLAGPAPHRVLTCRDQSWLCIDASGRPIAGGMAGESSVGVRNRIKAERGAQS